MSAKVRAVLAFVALFGFALSALMFLYAGMALLSREPRVTSAGALSILGAAGLITTIRLLQGKRWAWWLAICIAVLVFGFGMFCIWSAFYSKDAYLQSEAGFAFLIGIIVVIAAAVVAGLLNIPQVRRTFLNGTAGH